MERKLAAILSADVTSYSRLMGEDEAATIQTLTAYREVLATLIPQHRGRVVDAVGDNLLAEFPSVVQAVDEVPTRASGRIVAPYAGTITLTGPQDLHPTGPLAAPYPSSEAGVVSHGSPSQSEVVITDYVEKAETALKDLTRSQLTEPVPAKERIAVGRPYRRPEMLDKRVY